MEVEAAWTLHRPKAKRVYGTAGTGTPELVEREDAAGAHSASASRAIFSRWLMV